MGHDVSPLGTFAWRLGGEGQGEGAVGHSFPNPSHRPKLALISDDECSVLLSPQILTHSLSRDTKISKSIISEVLAGKRPFSRKMIRTLSRYFNVSVSVLAANF